MGVYCDTGMPGKVAERATGTTMCLDTGKATANQQNQHKD